ncbi:MAG: glycoside hydrolase family 99-like domain-containing protein [Gemmatimonadota bacterium]
MPTPRPAILAYYFPNYHPNDRRNAAAHGPGWSEWELVRAARPRFAGHRQPRQPAGGYADESDPEVMAGKIDLAARHGVDAFVFDWYWYDDGPFLESCLERGYLAAANRERVRFCCMWANHDWQQIHPIRRAEAPGPGGTGPATLYPGRVRPETFEALTAHLIRRYFTDPAHFAVAGCPYFSVYELGALVASFGDAAATRQALERFRARCREAGLPGLHLNAVVWGQPLLPGESAPSEPWELAADLGFDSLTSYVWVHYGGLHRDQPTTPYEHCLETYLAWWRGVRARLRLPYFPNLTVGWDSSPRCLPSDVWQPAWGYPYTSVLEGGDPAAFGRACARVRAEMDAAGPSGPAIVTVNSWNEWTEGSYLEPDATWGTGYLEALRRTFGVGDRDGS